MQVDARVEFIVVSKP